MASYPRNGHRSGGSSNESSARDTKLKIQEIDGVKLGMLSTNDSPFKASLILAKGFRELVSPTHGWPVYVVALRVISFTLFRKQIMTSLVDLVPLFCTNTMTLAIPLRQTSLRLETRV